MRSAVRSANAECGMLNAVRSASAKCGVLNAVRSASAKCGVLNAELWLLIYSHNELRTKSAIQFTLYAVKQFIKS